MNQSSTHLAGPRLPQPSRMRPNHAPAYRRPRRLARYGAIRLRRWHRDQCGATSIEWTMLLVAIGIPAATISLAVVRLLGQYSKMTLTLTNLPYP